MNNKEIALEILKLFSNSIQRSLHGKGIYDPEKTAKTYGEAYNTILETIGEKE